MAGHTLIEIPKFGSGAWAVEWMLTTADPTGDWFDGAPNSDVSIELKGITWSTAVMTLQGTNRHNIIPFTSGGTKQIVPGETVIGQTSGATAKVRAVNLNTTGTWAAGTAAGDLIIDGKTRTGDFTATEKIAVGSGTDDATLTLDVGSGADVHTLNDVEGIAIAYATGNDNIYQIQENVNRIRPKLTTVGTDAFVRVTLYFSRQVVAIEARS